MQTEYFMAIKRSNYTYMVEVYFVSIILNQTTLQHPLERVNLFLRYSLIRIDFHGHKTMQ